MEKQKALKHKSWYKQFGGSWLDILAKSIMSKISMSAWTKTNVESIENQTKTRQSGLSAKP